MKSRKIFQVVFFSLIIAAIDFAVLKFASGLPEYRAAISYFLTNLIFVFVAAKTGSNGVVFVQGALRATLYAMITPYPVSAALCIAAGILLGEAAVFFSKRRKSLAANTIAYFLFNICFAFEICIVDFSFAYSEKLLVALGAVCVAAVLAYILTRMALISALRRAGIEK